MLLKKYAGFLFGLTCTASVFAADLLDVYNDALQSDPTYQQALAQQLSDAEGVPISLSNLLPNFNATVTPSISKNLASGSANQVVIPGGNGYSTTKGYTMNLSLTQTLFDFGKFENLSIAHEVEKQAQATLNASLQDLMIRVSKAYLTVLEDEDNLLSAASTKAAYKKQLDQVDEQYKVGLKTITDVYTARASYKNSDADYIGAENTLADDKENLRAITGKLYPQLKLLSTRFPLTSPHPSNMEAWVQVALLQNWTIKSGQYATAAALSNIKQQMAGHLPTLEFQGTYNDSVSRNSGNSALTIKGSSQIHTTTAALQLGIPIFSGGGVVANTNKAKYDYEVTTQKLEQAVRTASTQARQSYLGVISGISKIKADIETIQSARSSLRGMEEQYRVGTETLVDVLNQRQKIYQSQKQYAADRYDYVFNLLALKQAAGTLSVNDLTAINSWLVDTSAANNEYLGLEKEEAMPLQKPLAKKTKNHKAHEKNKVHQKHKKK